MFKNQSRYDAVYKEDENNDTVSFNSVEYHVFIKGWNYKEWRPTKAARGGYGWEKVATVKTEEEAKQKCKDVLPSEDDE